MCAMALAARHGMALAVGSRMKLAAAVVAAVVAAVLVAAPLAARAQPGMTEPLPAPAPVDDSGDKSPGVALGLSLLGTAGGYAAIAAGSENGNEGLVWLGLGGILVGPSLGHFYAGESGRAIGHSLIRLGAVGTMFAGAVITFADCWDDEDGDCGSVGPVIIVGGAVLGVGSTVYSIADAPAAARRHNQERRRFLLTPAPLVGPGRSTGYGVALGATF
jgi:hypothetical protein